MHNHKTWWCTNKTLLRSRLRGASKHGEVNSLLHKSREKEAEIHIINFLRNIEIPQKLVAIEIFIQKSQSCVLAAALSLWHFNLPVVPLLSSPCPGRESCSSHCWWEEMISQLEAKCKWSPFDVSSLWLALVNFSGGSLQVSMCKHLLVQLLNSSRINRNDPWAGGDDPKVWSIKFMWHENQGDKCRCGKI